MRNLKRTLSLVLAALMLVGMMVVSAGAAGVDDFSDKDEIVNKDAVSMLTILGVINGKEDGSYFDPTGNVTRAEMAKMIATILNQGADVNDLYANMNTGLKDINNSWAKGYINYCYSLGIIAGRGDGTFDPTAPVTGNEAAKMLLVAVGYDPEIEGLTGAAWAIKTTALASTLGIFDDLTAPTSENLSRDNAALLIYNALDVEMIQKYEDGYAVAYDDKRTLLSTKYGVYKVEGVVVGNEWAQLDGTDIDASLATGKTKLADVKVYASTTSNTTGEKTIEEKAFETFNTTTPVDYMGKTVTMYVKKTTVLANSTVLGVVLKDGGNQVVTINSNQETNKDALKGTGLSIDGTTQFYVNYGYQSTQDLARAELGITKMNNLSKYVNANGIVMEVIDNDGDSVADYVLYTKEDLSVVSNVNASKETTTLRGFNNGKAIDNAEIVTELDLAVDDVVLAITYGGRYYVTAPETVTGQMVSYSSSKLDNQYISVDNTEYKPSNIGVLTQVNTSANGVGDIIDFDITLCEKPTGVQFKTTYEFFLDSNGYVRAFQPTEETVPNYALVLKSGYDPGVYNTDASGKVTVLLADGTEGTYALDFSASAANLGDQLNSNYTSSQEIMELKGFLGTDYTDNSTSKPWTDGAATSAYVFAQKNTDGAGNVDAKDYKSGMATGYVISYSLNDSGVMTIKNVIGSINGYTINDGKTMQTTSDTLTRSYNTGDGSVYYGVDKRIAVDLNTIAFYYEDADHYGVQTGYKAMLDVDAYKNFMAKTVVDTSYNTTTKTYQYTNTNLAEVILFNQSKAVVAKDFAYILSPNTSRNDGKVDLNGVNEQGEPIVLTVTDSHYANIFKSNSDFDQAYAYTTDANGVSTLEKTAGNKLTGVAYRLQVGTVALKTSTGVDYYTYDKDTVNILDVTNATVGEDVAKLSDFSEKDYIATLILDSNDKVRTAFVEEIPEGTTPDEVLGQLTVKYDGTQLLVWNPQKSNNTLAVANAITNALTNAGYTGVRVGSLALSGDYIGSVTADANIGGMNLSLSIPVKQAYRVTYNGSDLGYYASSSTVTIPAVSGSTLLVNNVSSGASDIAYTSAGYVYTVPANTWGTTYAIKDAYKVTAGANITSFTYNNNGTTATVTDGYYVAKDTVLTVNVANGYALDPDCALYSKVVNNKITVTEEITASNLKTVDAFTVTYTVNPAYGVVAGKPANGTVLNGKDYTISNAVIAPNGNYAFIGWQDASGNLYQPGDKITAVAGNVTLEAVFISKVAAAIGTTGTNSLSTAGLTVATNLSNSSTCIANTGVKAAVKIAAGPRTINADSTAVSVSSNTITLTFGDTTAFTGIAAGDTITLMFTIDYADGGHLSAVSTYTK